MRDTLGGGRPPSFYLNLALGAAALLVLTVVLGGGIDIGIGPLRIQLTRTLWPTFLLAALLVLRRHLTRDEEHLPWQERVFGEAGSTQERWRAVEAVVLCAVFYYLFVGGAALARYRSLAPDGATLGAAVQAVWNTAHGDFFSSSLAGGTYLGRDFAPVLALLAPLYRLWPSPELLVRVQTLLLALGAWPVYVLAVRELENRRWGAALAGLYLLHPAVRGMNLAGFHPLSLAVTPLLGGFALLDRRPRPGGYLLVLLALACGEEVWPAVAALGLYLCVVRRRWREGIFLSLVTFYGFLFLVTFVMPKLAGGAAEAAGHFSHLGSGPKEILKTVVLRPGQWIPLLAEAGRQRYLLDLVGPLAGLPLLGPLRLLGALPQLAANLISNDPETFAAASWHQAVIVPFLFAAAPCGLRRLQTGWGWRKVQALTGPLLRYGLIVLPLLLFGDSPARHLRFENPEGFAEGFATVRAMIPAESSLAASDPLVAHLAERRDMVIFPDTAGMEFVLVEIGREGSRAAGGTEGLDALIRLFRGEGYAVLHNDAFFLLLKKKQ